MSSVSDVTNALIKLGEEDSLLPDLIQYFKENGPRLNREYRPCVYHEDEGGGITDQDLENNLDEDIGFLETDCITTKEVILKTLRAKKVLSVPFERSNNSNQLLNLFMKYKLSVIEINYDELLDANHFAVLLMIENRTFMIQGYLDRYKYKIDEYQTVTIFDLLEKMFSNGDREIAARLFGDEVVVYNDVPRASKEITYHFYKF